MSTSVSSIVQGQTAQQSTSTAADSDAFANMTTSDFIKLMVTELQNQDPTSPMDNSQILQEVSQISAISSNNKLSSTLTSMQLQQDMTSGSVLLNQTITGLNASGTSITGKVDKVSVADSKVQLHIGNDTVDLTNVSEIDSGS